MKATDFFRALDDSDLDPYETRLLLRVWRRGQCWETPDSIAESTGMSRRKVYQVRKRLLELGWITYTEKAGRIIYQAAIPNTEDAIEVEETDVVNVHEVHGDAVVFVHDVHDPVHHVHETVHDVHKVVHHVHALPINRPKEDHNSKGTPAAADPIHILDRHFYSLTLLHPPVDPKAYIKTWEEPLNTFLLHAGGDVEKAKSLMTQAVELARKPTWRVEPYPLSSPHSIVNIATRTIDDDRSAVNPQEPGLTPDSIWQRAVAAITSGRPPTDDPPLFHAIRDVGWTAIQAADKYTEKPLKNRLFAAYRSAPA